jgi:hypothetical protein
MFILISGKFKKYGKEIRKEKEMIVTKEFLIIG